MEQIVRHRQERGKEVVIKKRHKEQGRHIRRSTEHIVRRMRQKCRRRKRSRIRQVQQNKAMAGNEYDEAV